VASFPFSPLLPHRSGSPPPRLFRRLTLPSLLGSAVPVVTIPLSLGRVSPTLEPTAE
jgi:hypothetical protein